MEWGEFHSYEMFQKRFREIDATLSSNGRSSLFDDFENE